MSEYLAPYKESVCQESQNKRKLSDTVKTSQELTELDKQEILNTLYSENKQHP